MQLQLDNNKKELKSHGTYAFPVNVSYEQLSRYERKSFLWHWHPEIEITVVTSGEMLYHVNNCHMHLKKGDALFGNTVTQVEVEHELLLAQILLVGQVPQVYAGADFSAGT